ncbi:Puromycin N-acetyltransferase 2 [Phlyctema vagabunda]|uniref:Puromycin N-acetyltransferase 2 n=1 Tax=Phlyctema vagabunda TaxID=108571 RepID=A0ABR4PMK7_9HELO
MSVKATRERSDIILRPAELKDVDQMATVAQETYATDIVSHFLCPKADQYPEDVHRRFRHRGHARHVDVRNLAIVACPASSPSTVVGLMQATRLGDDEGARALVTSKPILQRLQLRLLAWYFWATDGLIAYLWPDRTVDREHEAEFAAMNQTDDDRHWTSHPERQARWHVMSVAVLPKWQGQGIGTMLMRVILERAQQDNVICGLSASPAGEKLYRKVGFELLGDFCKRVPGEGAERGGGIMLWTPESAEGL